MSLIRGCFTFIGVITFLVLLAVVFGYCLSSLTPPLRTRMQPVMLSAEAVESLNKKLKAFQDQVEAAIKAKEERQVNLTITEEEANSKLVEILAEDTMPVKEILFNFREDNVLGYSVLNTPGLKVKVAVSAVVDISEGKPKIVAEELNIGILPVPRAMSKSASYMLDILTELITVPGDLPWKATAVQIADGQVTVSGVTKKVIEPPPPSK